MKQFNVKLKEPIIKSIVLKDKLSYLKVTLKKTIVQANITIKSIPLRLYAIVKNKLALKHEVLLSMHKLTGGYHIIGLKQNTAKALRTIFDKAANAIGLYTDNPTDILLTKTIKDIFHKIHLTSSEAGVVWNKIAGKGNNIVTLVQHAAIGELWVAAGKGENKLLLKQSESLKSNAVKNETVEHDMAIVHSAIVKSDKSTGLFPNIMGLTSYMGLTITRLRLLGEMDSNGVTNLTLANFDNMTLEDIDYITI